MDDLDERIMTRLDDPTTLADRTLAGRYRLVRPLGSGGMGVVWEGRDLLLGRRVAVKMLAAGRPGEERDPAATPRLIHEARVASLVSHPGVTAVFDVGIDGGRPFVVMELVEGPTLASILERGRLETAEATRIGARLAEALAAIHGRGIVHGDVTPANVMIAPDGRPKLTDLGIASFPTDRDDGPDGQIGSDGRTTQSERYGTLPYVAPEVLSGADPTLASDVFSLGVLLGQLCAGGGAAFAGGAAEMVERARAAEPSARPSAAAISSSLAAALPPLATVPLSLAGTSPTTRLEPTGAPTTTKLRPTGAAASPTGRLETRTTSLPVRKAPPPGRRPSIAAVVAAIVGPLLVGVVALVIIAASGGGGGVQTPSLHPSPSVTAPSPTQPAVAVPPTHSPPPKDKGKDHHHKHHGHGD